MPTGVLSVSPWITSMFSIGTPSFSATSWAKVVSWPWPWLWVPVNTWTLPVWVKRTLALSHRPTPAAERADHRRGCDAAGLDVAGEADAAQLALGLRWRPAAPAKPA